MKKKNIVDQAQMKAFHAGRIAFENGLPRTPPAGDPEVVRLWLSGYDIAKRFAEDEVLTPVVQ